MTSSSENDLPGLSNEESAQSSSGNLTDTERQEREKSFAQSFIDQCFFYNLDQLSPDNPLFFMQQQQQQQQQVDFTDQFLKESSSSSSHNVENRSVAATSLANSLESLRSVATSAGEQPLSFWSGLNNFLSNVTHNNLFPTIPNIARSFSDYLANHPVPFLSSFNQPTATPISSPMASSSKLIDPFKPPFELNSTGMQIRVLGVPQTGAKSRVETQIKLCIQLVTDGGDKALWWSLLKLPENMVTKDKQKKQSNINADNDSINNPEKMLYLQAKVICASDPTRKVTTCLGCIQRERKRSQRRKENKMASETDDDNKTVDEEQSLISDEERILLFNCPEIVDFSAGDTILPTRITCYCRHHSEKVGFCIYFEMLDYTGKKVAAGISPPIMITDDHKSNKVKSGQKRRRTDSEVSEMKLPISSNWMKSFPFGIGIGSRPNEENNNNNNNDSNNNNNNNNNNPLGFPYFPFASSSSSSSSRIPTTGRAPNIIMAPESSSSQLSSQPASNMIQHQQQQQAFNQLTPPGTTALTQSFTIPMARAKMRRMIPTQASVSGEIEVTILGTDFRPGMTVMFGDTAAKNVQYWSPNTLICTLPPALQPGAVVVSLKEEPILSSKASEDVMVFTYLAETDRALMELALQVVGMKTTGVVEDARKIAMRIVQGNGALDNVKK